MWPFTKKKVVEPVVALTPLPVEVNPPKNMREERRRGRLHRLQQSLRAGDKRPEVLAEIEMLKRMAP